MISSKSAGSTAPDALEVFSDLDNAGMSARRPGQIHDAGEAAVGAGRALPQATPPRDYGPLLSDDLRSTAGAGRKTINKQLALWRSAGIVDTARGANVIRNCEALRALAKCV